MEEPKSPHTNPHETEPEDRSSWWNSLAYFLRHRHVRARDDEWVHVHRKGSSGSGGGGGWWMVLVLIGGGYLAYQAFLWLVDMLKVMAPIIVIVFVLLFLSKLFRK